MSMRSAPISASCRCRKEPWRKISTRRSLMDCSSCASGGKFRNNRETSRCADDEEDYKDKGRRNGDGKGRYREAAAAERSDHADDRGAQPSTAVRARIAERAPDGA